MTPTFLFSVQNLPGTIPLNPFYNCHTPFISDFVVGSPVSTHAGLALAVQARIILNSWFLVSASWVEVLALQVYTTTPG